MGGDGTITIAVCGVGLIGGSIGLAARRRVGATVTGWDPDPMIRRRGLELGVVDRVAESVGDACAGASVIFCAAPVGSLLDLVGRALREGDPDAVVSDVGSTKQALVGQVDELLGAADSARFIGGHPLAGAETSGVENARPELFEGARWYLTPTAASSGIHYERLQRLLADLGARVLAIDPGDHDRLMANVSHLPHILANVLVSGAAQALGPIKGVPGERIPEVGPSFRDATRVAGSNPAIWGDIYASNSEAIAAALDGASTRLAAAAELLRRGDGAELAVWQGTAAEDRRRLFEARLVGGEPVELRVVVDNRPGVVAEIALALGRDGVNIEDMALHPAADMLSGAITLWIAGAAEAARAAQIVTALGHRPSVLNQAESGVGSGR